MIPRVCSRANREPSQRGRRLPPCESHCAEPPPPLILPPGDHEQGTRRTAPARAEDSSAEVHESDGMTSVGAACRVLILDDDPVVGSVIEAAATPHASYVERLVDPVQFRKRALEGFDVVFLDVILPGVDAIDLLEEFALHARSFPPIVFVSALDVGILDSAVAYARQRGFTIHGALEKPIRLGDVAELLGRINRRRTAPVAAARAYAADHARCVEALHAGEFFLRYQPQVNLRTRKVVGAEALIRWNHPELGELLPASFLPLLEDTATARELAEYVIEKALHDMVQHEAYAQGLSVSVNIHASVLRSPGFSDWVVRALERHGVPAASLYLEATEAAIVGEDAETLHALVKLRMAGVGLSIDDFGTGHSTLAQLWRMPVNEIKLDRSYVSTVVVSAKSKALVQGMVHMAAGMRARVVAEGIETEQVAAELVELGCGEGQGFLFARPQLPGELMAFVSSDGARTRAG